MSFGWQSQNCFKIQFDSQKKLLKSYEIQTFKTQTSER